MATIPHPNVPPPPPPLPPQSLMMLMPRVPKFNIIRVGGDGSSYSLYEAKNIVTGQPIMISEISSESGILLTYDMEGKPLYVFERLDCGNSTDQYFYVVKNEERDLYELVNPPKVTSDGGIYLGNYIIDGILKPGDRTYINRHGIQTFYYVNPVEGVNATTEEKPVILSMEHGTAIIPRLLSPSDHFITKTSLYTGQVISIVDRVNGVIVYQEIGAGGEESAANIKKINVTFVFDDRSLRRQTTTVTDIQVLHPLETRYPSREERYFFLPITPNPSPPGNYFENPAQLMESFGYPVRGLLENDPDIPSLISIPSQVRIGTATAAGVAGDNEEDVYDPSRLVPFFKQLEEEAGIKYAIFGGQALKKFDMKYRGTTSIRSNDIDVNITTSKPLRDSFSYLRASVVNMININQIYYEHFAKNFLVRTGSRSGSEFYQPGTDINLFVSFHDPAKMMQYIWNLMELDSGYRFIEAKTTQTSPTMPTMLTQVRFRNDALRTNLAIRHVEMPIKNVITITTISVVHRKKAGTGKMVYEMEPTMPEMDFVFYESLLENHIWRDLDDGQFGLCYQDPVYLLMVLLDLVKKYEMNHPGIQGRKGMEGKQEKDTKRFIALLDIIPLWFLDQDLIIQNQTNNAAKANMRKSIMNNRERENRSVQTANRLIKQFDYGLSEGKTIFNEDTPHRMFKHILESVHSVLYGDVLYVRLKENIVRKQELEMAESLLAGRALQSAGANAVSAVASEALAADPALFAEVGEASASTPESNAALMPEQDVSALPKVYLQYNPTMVSPEGPEGVEREMEEYSLERHIEELENQTANMVGRAIHVYEQILPGKGRAIFEEALLKTAEKTKSKMESSSRYLKNGLPDPEKKELMTLGPNAVAMGTGRISNIKRQNAERLLMIDRKGNNHIQRESYHLKPVSRNLRITEHNVEMVREGEPYEVGKGAKKRTVRTVGYQSFEQTGSFGKESPLLYPSNHPFITDIKGIIRPFMDQLYGLVASNRKERGSNNGSRESSKMGRILTLFMVGASILQASYYITDGYLRDHPLTPFQGIEGRAPVAKTVLNNIEKRVSRNKPLSAGAGGAPSANKQRRHTQTPNPSSASNPHGQGKKQSAKRSSGK
jgi:hypothetical protein